jgi:LmbE family N-acetylglucosaminyl deacetylase
VGAHPDDAELFAGGTLAGWRASGAEIAILVLTDGRLGSQDPGVDPADLARTRAAEVRRAAEILGAGVVEQLPFADGRLAASVSEAARAVTLAVREWKPDVLLGHDPWRLYELHPDHRAAGLATCDGAVAAREHHALDPPAPAAHRISGLWLFGGDHPNRFVDVSASVDAKLDALAAHDSQLGHLAGWREGVSDWNRRIGAERGYRFAEAFHAVDP